MRRVRFWAAVPMLIVTTVAPYPVAAQGGGTGLGEEVGRVQIGARGPAADLELPDAVIRFAPPLLGMVVGIVHEPEELGPDPAPGLAVDPLAAALDQVALLGGSARVCTTTGTLGAAAGCIQELLALDVPAIVLLGVSEDVSEPLDRALAGLTFVVGVGDAPVPPLAVRVAHDPLGLALEHARTAAAQRARPGRSLVPLVLAAQPGTESAFAGVVQQGFRETDRRSAKPVGRSLDPVAGLTALPDLLEQNRRWRMVLGDGLDLRDTMPGGAEARTAILEASPEDVALYAWRCDPSLVALIDAGGALKACGAVPGETAARAGINALGQLMAGFDVPGFIDVPAYTYRGGVRVGPGTVIRGPELPLAQISLTPDEQAAAAAALQGRRVGLVTIQPPGRKEPADTRAMRESLTVALEGVGATLLPCTTGGKARRAEACFDRLRKADVVAIVTLRSRTELRTPVAEAIGAGIPVIGIDDARMGDAGAVHLTIDRAAAGRHQGDQAAGLAAGTWPQQPVKVLIIDEGGRAAQIRAWPAIPAVTSDAIERSLIRQAPTVQVLQRLPWAGPRSKGAIRKLVRRNPDVRMLLGDNAPAALRALGDKAPQELIALAMSCDAATVTRIDEGGRLRACVGPDLDAVGPAAVLVASKLLAGGSVASSLTLPLVSHPTS